METTDARWPLWESAVQREATGRSPPPSPGTPTLSLSLFLTTRPPREPGWARKGGKEPAATLLDGSILTDGIRSRVSASTLRMMFMPSGQARRIGQVQERSSR
ncbi:hypothetical protein CSOJ01_05210 [Colletotrichum sojae]|uniref:Uncharacterized protein n=1 Tax=Colletotrichum sojae TaxID=2175907 RepID=A0A8H6JGX7_9PEZI|nr:hypothetical protein CSOJ01_05210 [Colletotrichum sojae]